jgi:hypothetical protein
MPKEPLVLIQEERKENPRNSIYSKLVRFSEDTHGFSREEKERAGLKEIHFTTPSTYHTATIIFHHRPSGSTVRLTQESNKLATPRFEIYGENQDLARKDIEALAESGGYSLIQPN